jgi:hypothetical protein
LAGGADHHLADRVDKAGVVVGDDQADPVQAAFAQVTQELLGPECLGLAVADHHAEDLPAAILGDAGGDGYGPGGDLVADPGLAVGGVEVDVGEAVWSSGLARKAVSCSSRVAQIRETSPLEIRCPQKL